MKILIHLSGDERQGLDYYRTPSLDAEWIKLLLSLQKRKEGGLRELWIRVDWRSGTVNEVSKWETLLNERIEEVKSKG